MPKQVEAKRDSAINPENYKMLILLLFQVTMNVLFSYFQKNEERR